MILVLQWGVLSAAFSAGSKRCWASSSGKASVGGFWARDMGMTCPAALYHNSFDHWVVDRQEHSMTGIRTGPGANFWPDKYNLMMIFEAEELPEIPDFESAPPFMHRHRFDEKEAESVRQVHNAMYLMSTFIDCFYNALQFFNWVSPQENLWHWRSIAINNAVINAYEFGDVMGVLQKKYKRCQPLMSAVRTRAIQDAIDRFEKEFPDLKEMRAKAAHPSGHLLGGGRQSAFIEIYGVMVHGQVAGRTIFHSHNGGYIDFELSNKTLNTLRDIRVHLFDAFR